MHTAPGCAITFLSSTSECLKKNHCARAHRKRFERPGKPAARPVSRDKKSGTVTVSLRIPIPMLKEIDEAVRVRPYKMPRHLWLLEAIHEKLIRLRQGEAESS